MGADLLSYVTRFYLDSHDFNGLPLSQLPAEYGARGGESLGRLIAEGSIDVVGQADDVNPHVKRFSALSDREVQLARVRDGNVHHTCLYPSPQHLAQAVDRAQYGSRPFTLELALGGAQLEFRSFDLAVLEFYRSDPRYFYECGSTHGHISIADDYCKSEDVRESDKVLLQTFGFSFSEDEFNRAVAVFLCYLSGLSAEHQQVWKARELSGEFRLHPEYFRTSILGEWPEKIPIFTAFLMEMKLINEMSSAMDRKPLFRNVPQTVPKGFSFLIRPTCEEFERFVHLLDKLLSDNLDQEFFRDEIAHETEERRKDGKTVVRTKGTLQMLDDWIRAKFRTDDWEPWDRSIKQLKKIRKLRQEPAHKLSDDRFDQAYEHKQRKLVMEAYSAVRTIRLILAEHPATAGIEVSPLLYSGKICDF